MRRVKSLAVSVFTASCLQLVCVQSLAEKINEQAAPPTIIEPSNESRRQKGISLPDAKVLARMQSARGPYQTRSVQDLLSGQADIPDGPIINSCTGTDCKFEKNTVLIKLAKPTAINKNTQSIRAAGINNVSNSNLLTTANFQPLFKNAKAPKQGAHLMTASGQVIPKPDLTRWYKLNLNDSMSVEHALEQLKLDPRVEIAEMNLERSMAINNMAEVEIQQHPVTANAFNDPKINEQWHLQSAKISEAWQWLNENDYDAGGSRDVVVAVIDSGVDYNHEDLALNMWINSGEIADNGIDDDNNGFVDDVHGVSVVGESWSHSGDPMDDHGHGTHVAGIIAAEADNGIGLTGIAHNVQIMAIKAAQYSGVLTSSDIAEAVTYAAEQGADVINMSFGGNFRSAVEEDALAVAFGKAVLIASAGNDGMPNEAGCYPLHSSSYPASYPWVLGVMAERQTPAKNGDNLAGFSNFDCKTQTSIEYEVMAPGVDIMSTLPDNGYAAWDGTSMAAPVVSGMAALLRSKFNDKTIHSSRFLMGQLGATGPLKQGFTYNPKLPAKKYHSADALAALINTPKPNLAYLEHWLWDENSTDSTNDDDGLVDAGETIDLALIVRNYWGQADNVQVSIEAKVVGEGGDSIDPYISWVTDTVDYGSVGTYSNDDNGLYYENDEVIGVRSPFRFKVADNTPNNHIIPFIVTFTAINGLDSEDNATYTSTSKFNLLVHRGRELPSIIAGDAIGTPGGDLDTDGSEDGIVTLDNSVLYIIDKPVLVEQGVSLKVGPGAVIQWWGSQPDDAYSVFQNAYLQVEGTLQIEGSVEQPVTLKPADLFPDRMVVIKQGRGGNAHFSYADITNLKVEGFYGDSEDGSEPIPLYEHVRFRRGFEGYALAYEKREDGYWGRINGGAQLNGAATKSQLIGLGGINEYENKDVRDRYIISLPKLSESLVESSNFSAYGTVQSNNVLLTNYKLSANGGHFSSTINNASIIQDFKVLDAFNYDGKTYALFHNKSTRNDSKLLDDAQAFAQSISADSHVLTLSSYGETIAINDWLYDLQQRTVDDWALIPGCELHSATCFSLTSDNLTVLTGLKRDTAGDYAWLNAEIPAYDVTDGQFNWDPVQWYSNRGSTPPEYINNYQRNTKAMSIRPVQKLIVYLQGQLQSQINSTFNALAADDPRRLFEPGTPLTNDWLQTRLESYISDRLAYELEQMLIDSGYSSFQECVDAGYYNCAQAGSEEQWQANKLIEWESSCADDEGNCRYNPPNYLSWFDAENNYWQENRFKRGGSSGFLQDMQGKQSNHRVLIELSSEYTLADIQQELPDFKNEWKSDSFKNNAILNQWWDPNPDHWLQIDAGSGDSSRYYDASMDLSGNYWGTDNSNLIEYSIVDYSDDFNKAVGKYSPRLSKTEAPESAYPFVSDVRLLDADSGERADLRFGAEKMVWQVEFNRDMDTNIQPKVNFGPEFPYTDFAVNGDWIDARTWQGQVRISPVASDGYQYVRVTGAVAADDAWLVTGTDYARYRFEVITSGTESLNLQASGGDGFVDLTWSQDDFDTFYGFNLYRSTSATSGFTRIQQSLIGKDERNYRDENVQPGITYYYHFTVSSGGGESTPSNVAVATPSDTVKPVINHTQITTSSYGANQLVQAMVTDNISVESVTLYYRILGNTEYIAIAMIDSGNGNYSATIPGSAMVAPGIEYYIAASDGASVSFSGRAGSPNKTTVADEPVINNLSPKTGSIDGGTVITLVGANFKDGLTITIGGASCAAVEFIDASKAKCTTSPHTPEVVAAIVTNPDDKQGKLIRAFTYGGDNVSVWLDDIQGASGQVIEVPLSIDGVSGLTDYEARINFDSKHLKLVDVRKGDLTSAWNLLDYPPSEGVVNLAAYAAGGPSSGTGELAVLEFLVLAEEQVSSELAIASISLNDHTIDARQFNGQFTYFPGFNVTGSVTYWNNSAENVVASVSLNGYLITSSSNEDGSYELTGVKAGTNTLVVAKDDQNSDISAFDASLILKHAVGQELLSANAQIAADVNNSGSVSAADAYKILSYVVGLSELPFDNQLSTWKFTPATQQFDNLQADQTGVNFKAILVGDASGNWSRADAIQTASIQSVNIDESSNELLSFGNVRQVSASRIAVDVALKPQGELVTGIELDLEYSDGLELASVIRSDEISEHLLVSNDLSAQKLAMAIAGQDPLTENVTLLTLTFNSTADEQILRLTSGMVNETTVATSSVTLAIREGSFDSDGDGVADQDDAFPDDVNESVDTDLDGIGNNADTDDDNDGIVDEDDSAPLDNTIGDSEAAVFAPLVDLTVEATGPNTPLELPIAVVKDNNLNAPVVVSDYDTPLPLGSHQITWTATDFAGNISTAIQFVDIVDTTAPEFGDLPVKIINARGLLTKVTQDIELLATDLVDGEITATVDADISYASGVHNIAVSAQDTSGNIAQADVVIHINPLIELGLNDEVEAGTQYRVPITLSGTAAVYPVTIAYQLTGAFSGNDSAELVLASGTEQAIDISLSDRATAGDLLTVTLTSATNAVLAHDNTLELTVVDENRAPTVNLLVQQGGMPVSVIDAQAGVVIVTAMIEDVNRQDSHSVLFNEGNSPFVDLDADGLVATFELEPEQLSSGTYGLSVQIAESNTSELFALTVDVELIVVTDFPELNAEDDVDEDGISDATEGFIDSDHDGIADYLDSDSNTSRLPIGDDTEPMQTVYGLQLGLGDVVHSLRGLSAVDASISIEDIEEYSGESGTRVNNAVDTHFTALSPIVNFNLSGLSVAGEAVPVVIPLAKGKVIPEGAVYRKYSTTSGWFDFVLDDNNSISSANKDSDGNCPPPLATEYIDGLHAFDDCIQLLIVDGGANDADGRANGMVKDPGVLTTEIPNRLPVINLLSRVDVVEESDIHIDVSNTFDAEGDELSYRWTQVDGLAVLLQGQNTSILSFGSPTVETEEILTFELAVNDGRGTTIATIAVFVAKANEVPTVVVEAHVASFNEGSSVTLKSTSVDPDGDAMTYQWQQISGPTITIEDSTDMNASFIAPQVSSDQTIELRLTVSDGTLLATATTSFLVKNVQQVTPPKESGGGGSLSWLFILTGLGLARRKTSYCRAA
ncbi:hypothetical protein A9Q98_13565 [Thalassotalea sp. 42_200_T64]|nr:hypothetical protein A9Q98_13565 [Thalassotalea sp. 42_200_T64]